MISLTQFFQDLTNPALAFLPKALLVAVLSAIVCGVVGAHVVLRGMAFIGDAVAHAVFPGLAIAFALQASVVLGGAVAGIAVAVLIAVFSQRRRIKEDTVIGIFFAAAFAAGLVVISKVQGYTASLTSFLFGSITGVAAEDIVMVAIVGALVLALLMVFHNQLIAVSLDRETAAAQNIRVFAFDLLLCLAVTAAVVMSVRTVGNILVLALLVTPAATARLLTDRLPVMMALSAAIGAVGSVVGVYLSWAWDIPTGATIVLVVTACFLVAFLGSALRSFVTTPRAPRTRSRLAPSKVAANVVAVVLLAGAGFVGPVTAGGAHLGAPGASATPEDSADSEPEDGADSTDADIPAASSESATTGDNGTVDDVDATDGADSRENGEGLNDEDETLVEGLIRVFKKLNVDVLRLAEKLPAAVKNIIELTESLRGDKPAEDGAQRGKGETNPSTSQPSSPDTSAGKRDAKKKQERADRVAEKIIDRTKNPGSRRDEGRATGEDAREKPHAGGDASGPGTDSDEGASNADNAGAASHATDAGGVLSGSDAGAASSGEGAGGAGEEDTLGSDELLEQAAEDVLAEDGVEKKDDKAGGIKALGYSGKARGGKGHADAGTSHGHDAANTTGSGQTKLQQLASSLTAGGFGGGLTLGIGLMALLGGGLFFLMAARNTREMRLAMLHAELDRELEAERNADWEAERLDG